MVQYYGQFQLDKVINDNYINNRRDGFFVECGAFDGTTECSCKFFEESLGWKGMNIEAVPHLYEQLKNNRPNSINVNGALSDENGTKVFTHVVHPVAGYNFGNGSFCLPSFHREDLRKQGCSFVDMNIPCYRFDKLFVDHNLPPIDLFVLDVEGYEMQVVKGMSQMPKSHWPKCFCVEYPWCGLDNLKSILNDNYNYAGEYYNNAFFLIKG